MGTKGVDEEAQLQFTVTAGDPNDSPANTVTLSVAGLPTGATFTSATGVFAWTPGETQQGQYVVRFTATDNGTPPRNDSEDVTVTVREVNDAPVLDPLGNKSVDEETQLQLTVTAGDPNDIPPNNVVLSATGLPTGATFTPATGVFAWTPGETQQGQYVVRFTATDDGTPPRNDSEDVTITVREVNDPPVLDPIGTKSVDEETQLQFTVTAGDPNDIPPNNVVLSVTGLPTGATFTPATGVFAWTPTEAQQGQYVVRFTATDDGTPPRNDSEDVTITVREVNDAPALDPIGNKSVDGETLLQFTVTAGDPNDIPPNTVTLSVTGLPAGATFTPATGVFAWTPTEAQRGEHIVTFTATDDGTENRSASELLKITVLGPTWQNPHHPCDVNGDGFIKPVDVLVLINDINAHGSRKLTAPLTLSPPPFLDPTGDDRVAPVDVLTVINYINAHGSGPIPLVSGGEGEYDGPMDRHGREVTTARGVMGGTTGFDWGTGSVVVSTQASRGQPAPWLASLESAPTTLAKVTRPRMLPDRLLGDAIEASELEEAITAIAGEVAESWNSQWRA
jgi:hypothetical protein